MKELSQPSLETEYYGPGDLVAVADTSLLIQLGSLGIWAHSIWEGFKQRAHEEGKKFRFFIPDSVSDEYEKMRLGKRTDEFGLPLVHQTLEELLGSLVDVPVSAGDSAKREAVESWLRHASARFKPESHRIRKGPAKSDLLVTAYARTIARQGAEVYVASADFKDVIDPLREDSGRLSQEGLMVNAAPPSPIEQRGLAGLNNRKWLDRNGKLRPALNREVVADLQASKRNIGAHTYVIFEENVHSGSAILDVAVGVEEFANIWEAGIPEEYRKSGGQFYILPVLGLRSRMESGANGLMRSYFRRSARRLRYRLLLVEEQDPFFPRLISPSGKNDAYYKSAPTLQTTMDFLYHQTDSRYAQLYYRPNTRSAKRGKV